MHFNKKKRYTMLKHHVHDVCWLMHVYPDVYVTKCIQHLAWLNSLEPRKLIVNYRLLSGGPIIL